jgi:hypothetical protein
LEYEWWESKRKRNWTKIEAIATIFAAVVALVAVATAGIYANSANNIDQQLVDIEKRQFAFPVDIIPSQSTANVYGEYWDYSANSSVNPIVDAVGNASVQFMVFTPDKGYIHLEVGNFTPIQTDYSSLPPPYNLSSISYNFGSGNDQEVNSQTSTTNIDCSVQVNFNITANYLTSWNGIPISEIASIGGIPIGEIKSLGGVPLPPSVNESLPIQNQIVLIDIGTVNFSGEFVDKQFPQTIPITVPVDLHAYIKWYYR